MVAAAHAQRTDVARYRGRDRRARPGLARRVAAARTRHGPSRSTDRERPRDVGRRAASRRRHASALSIALRPALAFAAGALLLAIALLIIAPAALLDARINMLSDGRLRIANATGTLWQGSGELVLLPAGARQAFFWRLD